MNVPIFSLVCGSINGQFNELFEKIKKVNKKSGPFSAVYCVGDFFVPGCEENWKNVRSQGCEYKPKFVISD